MKYLDDECCPRDLVQALRDLGHDVHYAAGTDRQSPDDVIAAAAIDEDRVLLTADYDFGELAIRHGLRLPGIVLLGFRQEPKSEKVARAVQVITELGDGLRGQLTIVMMTRVRVRPLPGQ